MKKMLGILLVLSLALAGLATSVSALVEDADVVGTWYLTVLVGKNGIKMHPSEKRMDVTITVNPDGTCLTVNNARGVKTPNTWTLEEDTLVMDDGDVFAFADDTLSIVYGDTTLVFEREAKEKTDFVPSPVVPATDISEFDGEWLGTQMVSGGVAIPTSQLTPEFSASITPDTILLREVYEKPRSSGEKFNVVGPKDVKTKSKGTLEDGALTATRKVDGKQEDLLLQLHEDGTLSVTFGTGNGSYQIFYERLD